MWEEAAPVGLALRRGPVRFVEEAASSPEVAVDVGSLFSGGPGGDSDRRRLNAA